MAAVGLVVMLAATLALTTSNAEAQGGPYACIESDLVQNSVHGEGMSVGNIVVTDDYGSYTVHTGGPTCTLDPADCDASLNLYVVADVKACLADLEAGDDGSPADAATAGSAQVGSLAYTGAEHELGAAFAAALIGAGSAALGMARARRRDS